MADKADFQIVHEALIAISSCDFIKGVSAASAAVFSAGYLFHASRPLRGQGVQL